MTLRQIEVVRAIFVSDFEQSEFGGRTRAEWARACSVQRGGLLSASDQDTAAVTGDGIGVRCEHECSLVKSFVAGFKIRH